MQSIRIVTKILIVCLITLIINLYGYKIYCQNIHHIYRDDTCFINTKDKTYYYSFKDSLPDGKWIIYNVDRKDSLSKCKKIASKGNFKNQKKEGLFEMYNYSSFRKKEIVNYYICYYKNGLKHGAEEEYLIIEDTIIKHLKYHGEYFKGEKDGCFIRIEEDGYLEEQSLYKDGIMKYYLAFAGKNATKYKEIEVITENTFNYTLYIFNDSISKIVYHVNNGILENIDLIDNDKKIIKSRTCNLKIVPFYHQYQIPMVIIYLDKEVLMDDALFMKYLEDK